MTNPTYKNFPLASKYFGHFFDALVTAYVSASYVGRFFLLAYSPDAFEQRLARIEKWGLTASIVKEIGYTTDAEEMDRRLMDAWAELRTIDLLALEGFLNIEKVTESADLIATYKDMKFAFQVKRIKGSLSQQIEKRNPPGEQRNSSPFGTSENIHNRFDDPVSYFFWDTLLDKNSKYKKYHLADHRCLVIVSADDNLQDRDIRHIACQKICEGIRDPSFGNRNFESLLWLPDISPGAWIVFDECQNIRCYADWQDDVSDGQQDRTKINRREMDLNSPVSIWISDTVFRFCD